MAVLGLFLLLAAAGLTLDVVFQNTSSISVDAVGQTSTLSSGWLFVAGVATGAIGLIGVSLLVSGMARARRRRAVLAESSTTMQDLQADRDHLAAQLDRERNDRTSTRSARRQHGAPTAGANEIDLASEQPRAESTPSEYASVPDADGREPHGADGHESAGSGRHGFFRRRDH